MYKPEHFYGNVGHRSRKRWRVVGEASHRENNTWPWIWVRFEVCTAICLWAFLLFVASKIKYAVICFAMRFFFFLSGFKFHFGWFVCTFVAITRIDKECKQGIVHHITHEIMRYSCRIKNLLIVHQYVLFILSPCIESYPF